MVLIRLIPKAEFDRVRRAVPDRYERAALMAAMCRANTLAAVKRAGSGHIGSSFSAMDLVVWLYLEEMNTLELGVDHPDRDVYFSSKGHDVPGLYSVLHAVGVLPADKLLALRRLGGVEGHPDVRTPGIEANTGSLGMGISKGRGIAVAQRLLGRKGRVFVMTGDGELQEGQIFEALQATAHQKVHDLTVIVDHNKLQSDRLVSRITDLGDLPAKFRAFGWYAIRSDGHDSRRLAEAFDELRSVTDRPKVLIADTIKGRGVSFMEHPVALEKDKGTYRWHAGAPDDASFQMAHDELVAGINATAAKLGLGRVALEDVPAEEKALSGVSSEFVSQHFGEALVEIGARRKDLVVLDGDLALDCRIRKFEETFPERFIENGIAEQDMVSMAGGLALRGLLPVVNSFANFLAARANEQIYNNAGEKTKIIYVAHFGGLLPAGPGKSHQATRDISLFGALPNCTILEPASGVETRMAVEYCVEEARESCVLRLIIGPSPRVIPLPQGYRLRFGHGVALTEGRDAILFSYGPVMLHEALAAAEALARDGFGLTVVNMPWLNRVDRAWLEQTVAGHRRVYVLDDHSPYGGLGDSLLNAMNEAGLLGALAFRKLGIREIPACGAPLEVLRHHGVDSETITHRIRTGE
jgi:transketolase